jgi:hypothetical protein
MTENVKEWFVPKFEDTVHHQYQQNTSRLGDTVAGGGTFTGDKIYFPRMGVAEAYDSPQFARLALANVAQDFIEVQASPKFIAFGLWDPNANKYSIATATEYGKQAASAIARANASSTSFVAAASAALSTALPAVCAAGALAAGGGSGAPKSMLMSGICSISAADRRRCSCGSRRRWCRCCPMETWW